MLDAVNDGAVAPEMLAIPENTMDPVPPNDPLDSVVVPLCVKVLPAKTLNVPPEWSTELENKTLSTTANVPPPNTAVPVPIMLEPVPKDCVPLENDRVRPVDKLNEPV